MLLHYWYGFSKTRVEFIHLFSRLILFIIVLDIYANFILNLNMYLTIYVDDLRCEAPVVSENKINFVFISSSLMSIFDQLKDVDNIQALSF